MITKLILICLYKFMAFQLYSINRKEERKIKYE